MDEELCVCVKNAIIKTPKNVESEISKNMLTIKAENVNDVVIIDV